MEVISEIVIPVLGEALLAVLDVVGSAISGIIDIIASLIHILTGIVEFFVGVFTLDWEKAWEGVSDIVVGIFDGIVSFIEGVVDTIISIISGLVDTISRAIAGIGELLGGIFSSGGPISSSGGSRRSLNAPAYVPASVPALASGGVLYDTTLAMIGEYPGAGSNPEIVAPQNIMKETMEQANAGVINAVMAMGNKVTKAIEDKDSNVYMDSVKVTRKVMDTQGKLEKYKGTTLVER